MRYEISIRGRVGAATRASFGEFDVSVGEASTVLRGEIVDQPALLGVIDRIQRLGLVLEDLHVLPAADG